MCEPYNPNFTTIHILQQPLLNSTHCHTQFKDDHNAPVPLSTALGKRMQELWLQVALLKTRKNPQLQYQYFASLRKLSKVLWNMKNNNPCASIGVCMCLCEKWGKGFLAYLNSMTRNHYSPYSYY